MGFAGGPTQPTAAIPEQPRRWKARRYRERVRRYSTAVVWSGLLFMLGVTTALVTPVNGLQRGLPVTVGRVLSTEGRVAVDVSLPTRLALAVTSEGLAGSGSPAWHAAGFTGAGVKVAILDLGFDGLGDVPADDLPADVVEMAFDSDGIIDRLTDHGTQMAEIVQIGRASCRERV